MLKHLKRVVRVIAASCQSEDKKMSSGSRATGFLNSQIFRETMDIAWLASAGVMNN